MSTRPLIPATEPVHMLGGHHAGHYLYNQKRYVARRFVAYRSSSTCTRSLRSTSHTCKACAINTRQRTLYMRSLRNRRDVVECALDIRLRATIKYMLFSHYHRGTREHHTGRSVGSDVQVCATNDCSSEKSMQKRYRRYLIRVSGYVEGTQPSTRWVNRVNQVLVQYSHDLQQCKHIRRTYKIDRHVRRLCIRQVNTLCIELGLKLGII
jgi:hypothetical protein